MARILIAGCGYAGSALGHILAGEGHEVWGLCRRPERLPASIRPLGADLTDPATLRSLPSDLEAVFYTTGPDGRGEEAYRAAYVTGLSNLIEALRSQGQQPRRLIFTSSTSVYPQSNGEWVDEDSPVSPEPFGRGLLLAGEHLCREGSFPGVVLRLAGIYGPGRARLIESVRRGEAACPEGPPRYTNRIHRDDCAGALRHLMALERPGGLYIGADHEPADRREVIRWLAGELGAPLPRTGPQEAGRRRAAGSKRCSNARLLASGYRFRHPTYREGYAAIIEERRD
ncbi:MAG: hypothetical protein A3J27_15300 [Candidatus Tectomicrobia bacterium RIFCSPLOWO2_12_FULL_69_37]|nr:MAG: hypothetical protein A3J27_15300 [Candidatus Tectomicrobia bacterium RIFCSPLOWO2_12_FULL_69_37]